MITNLNRREILLVGLPFAFLVLEQFWFTNLLVDFHIYDTMYVIERRLIIFIILLVMGAYFVLHMFLHTKKWRSHRICNIHVTGTVICLLIMYAGTLFLSQNSPAENITIEDFKKIRAITRVPALLTRLTFLVFILLQVFFLLYFLFALIKNARPKSG